MNVYKLSQTVTDRWNYYDSCVVVAKDAHEAAKIHPNGDYNWDTRGAVNTIWGYEEFDTTEWAEPNHIKVELIGVADSSVGTENAVICASFNAG